MFQSCKTAIRHHCTALLVLIFLFGASSSIQAETVDYNLPGLSATVTVYEDALGIPSIVAESEQDAVFVLGYLHARDRFFQMDLNRKAAAGRAAELVGAAALSSDIQFRTFGLGRAALASWQALGAESRGVLQAYANGVNIYLASNPLPAEYSVLELTSVEPWTPLDTMLVVKGLSAVFSLSLGDIDRTITLGAYNFVGDVGGFSGAALFFEDTHRQAPADDRVSVPGFLGSIGGIGQASTESGGPDGKSRTAGVDLNQLRVPDNMLALAKSYREKVDSAGGFLESLQHMTKFAGSNMWVIGGEHTATGDPMLANDPHITLDTPATFHEAQLVYPVDGEPWHVNGMVVPGTPGVLLGCSKFACWGFTVNPLDVTDFFADEILATGSLPFPTHTVHDGVPEPIQAVYQSYFVNAVGDEVEDNVDRASVPLDGGGISFLVPRRYNGPIIEFLDDSTALTAQNTGLGATFEAEFIRRINQADTMEEFKEGLQFFDTGIQNVLYADRDGNIAYFTTSENPIREDLAAGTVEGLPPFFIRDGTGALNNEWLPVQNPQPHQALPFEILPFDEMPNVTNPASGFVNNANNDPIGISLDNNTLNQLRPGGNGIYYLNAGYASGYRMGRIDRTVKSWVDSDMPITMEMMQELQGNAQMLDAELILPMLMPAFEGLQLPPEHPISQALDVLSTWDYSTPTGIPEGYDAGDDPMMESMPDETEIRNSAAATIFALWRSRLIANTIDATLTAIGLGDYRPPGSLAWNAFKHHLENYPTRGGVGASGIPFFSQGFEATVQGSLAQALELLASDEFAPAFGNSLNVMDYRWGKLHRIVFDHPFNSDPFNIPNGGGFMDLGEGLPGLARQGGYEVVDDSDHNPRASTLNGFMFGSGPNRRFVGNIGADRIDAVQVLPGGQSGVFLHPNYSSQLPLWLTNSYHPMAMGEEDAQASALWVYSFNPIQSYMGNGSKGKAAFSPLRPVESAAAPETPMRDEAERRY
ncbi:MAG: penicillin acylase family protein [Lysobacterales bacterium]